MANLKDIRDRIKSVKSIQKVTKAMKMVAAAKMRKAQERMEQARPYSNSLSEIKANSRWFWKGVLFWKCVKPWIATSNFSLITSPTFPSPLPISAFKILYLSPLKLKKAPGTGNKPFIFPRILMALSLGLFVSYISGPQGNTIYVYPNPDNIDKIHIGTYLRVLSKTGSYLYKGQAKKKITTELRIRIEKNMIFVK